MIMFEARSVYQAQMAGFISLHSSPRRFKENPVQRKRRQR
jgi:hypothetical protein